MEFSAQQIADFLGGKIEGNPSVKVSDFSKIEESQPGTLSFLSNPKYQHYIYDCNASIVLVNDDFEPERPVKTTLIRVDNAYQALATLLSLVEQSKPRKTGISSLAYVSSSAILGDNVYIAPFSYIGDNVTIADNCSIYSGVSIEDNVKVSENVVLHSGVKIYQGCILGKNCTLHAGCVIGADGFGFAPTADGTYKKIPQMGNVILEDDVEVGANTTIDRATFGSTVVRKGVKIDNLVQIAHNVELGTNTVIAAQSGVSGSTKIGTRCTLAGQVGIGGHLHIADGTIFGAQAGISGSVKEPGKILQGTPALPILNFQKSSIIYKNLPDIQKLIFELKKRIEELEAKVNN